MTHESRTILFILIGLGLVACDAAADAEEREPIATPTTLSTNSPRDTLTTEEREQGFRLLFDGETLSGWRGFKRDDVPSARRGRAPDANWGEQLVVGSPGPHGAPTHQDRGEQWILMLLR